MSSIEFKKQKIAIKCTILQTIPFKTLPTLLLVGRIIRALVRIQRDIQISPP